MFKKVITTKREGEAPRIPRIEQPLNMLDSDKSGQKLIRFANPELVTGWASDISAVTKQSQSQILEEVVLQQFMPHNRTLQDTVERLYGMYQKDATISSSVTFAIETLLLRRTSGRGVLWDSFSYKPIVELTYKAILGKHFEYNFSDYKEFDDNPMFHLMHSFINCGDWLEEHLKDVDDLSDYNNFDKDMFSFYKEGWNNGHPLSWFSPLVISNLLDLMVKYWDKGFNEKFFSYIVVYDILKMTRGMYKEAPITNLFNEKDRLVVLSFINDLDEFMQEKDIEYGV